MFINNPFASVVITELGGRMWEIFGIVILKKNSNGNFKSSRRYIFEIMLCNF